MNEEVIKQAEILYNEIYDNTKQFGRTDFIKQLMNLQRQINELQKENRELKLTLKGTTHCFDEEEHKRLEEENKELKEQISHRNK